MKIGIMGGTFDPVHVGHLLAAERARECAGLDEVWFMPSFIPPHKRSERREAPEHRLAMVQLAVAKFPEFRVTDVELLRGGTSYTYDTMKALCEAHPAHDFYFIIGGDMVAYLPNWHRIEELSELVTFIGLDRPEVRIQWEEQAKASVSRILHADMPQVAISSTDIRNRIASGLSVRFLVPDSVYAYIKERGLYGMDA